MPTPVSRLPSPRARTLPILGLVLAAAIFAADLQAPAGIAIGMLYVGVILLGLWSSRPAFPLEAAYGATVLVLADLYASWDRLTTMAVVVNYPLMILVFLISALVVRRFVAVEKESAAHLEQLGDFKRALDAAAIVATTDVKGRITFVNEKFVEISKYPREELLGQDHRIINSGYHSKDFIRDLWHTIANGRIWRGELRNRAKDGAIYWVDTTIVPFLDERGKPYQYMAIRYDVTDRKRSEDRLREQAALARLGEMAAVVAHEVKNPLAAIKGALQVIGGRMPADGRDRAVIGDIVARVDSLNDIVQDLLVFARPREPQLTPVPLADLVENTAALMRKDPAHGSVVIAVSGSNPVVPLDIDQMRTVFLNLLLNAVQATGAGGRVHVSIAADDLAATVAVADNGPGIAPDVRAKMFEPFFTTKHRGTGLGLPTARRVVDRHRGTVEVDCPLGGGTVVTVTLPMQ